MLRVGSQLREGLREGITKETKIDRQRRGGGGGTEGNTYSADFQKCPGCDRRRFRFGSFSSMSMSLVKVGRSSCSKAQQKSSMS